MNWPLVAARTAARLIRSRRVAQTTCSTWASIASGILVETPEEFCEVLERSQLLGQTELEAVRALLRRPTQPSALNLAQWLVKHGHVTVWQAERLLGGSTQFFLAGTYSSSIRFRKARWASCSGPSMR
jgi:hypothetical protein